MSPIKGLTDAPRAFIRVGRIKKGMKDPETGAMKDLDYFRTVFDPSAKAIEEEFNKIYGLKPTRINIRLAFRTVPEVWDANFECYKKGGLIAKAGENDNGLYWIYYRDPATSEVLVRDGRPVGSNGEEFVSKKIDLSAPIYSYMGKVKQADGTFKQQNVPVYLEPAGRLNVVVPEIAHLRVGFMEFCPGSPRDIRTISAELAGIDLWARNVGKDITGIPMVLTRREEQVTVNINGVLSRKASWVVHIEVGGEWGDKALESLQMRSLPDSVVDGEVVEDGDFEDEFPQLPATVSAPVTPAWRPIASSVPPDFEQAQKEMATAGPQPVTGEVELTRPWSPAVLKAKVLEAADLLEKGAEKRNQKLEVGPNDGKILASIVDAIFNGDKGISRHIVCTWIVGTGSTKEMTPAQIKALFHILGIKGEPRYESAPSYESIEEFRAALPVASTEIKEMKT